MELRDLLPGTSGPDQHGGVSFDEIVVAHSTVTRLNGRAGAIEQEQKLKGLWTTFAGQEGEVLSSFFGGLGKTGAALTVRSESRGFPLPSLGRRPHLHVALDLATAGAAADLVSRYERLRVKADQLLAGDEREHITRVLYDRVCRVIRIVDQALALDMFKADEQMQSLSEVFDGASRRDPTNGSAAAQQKRTKTARATARKTIISEAEKRIENALTTAQGEVSQAEDLCSRAVRRGAMMAYFVGMLIGIVVFTVLGIGLSFPLANADIAGFSVQSFLTVFVAGAVGAIVSVMSRMSSGDSWLEFETARSYLRLLGMFRPLIGAIFGVALYFGIQSGVLQFIQPPDSEGAVFFFFAFIAFLAGFSERWASDILVPIKDHQPAAEAESRRPLPDRG